MQADYEYFLANDRCYPFRMGRLGSVLWLYICAEHYLPIGRSNTVLDNTNRLDGAWHKLHVLLEVGNLIFLRKMLVTPIETYTF